ncbi:MAG: FG-GAP-like repeat-containing protein, partial [Bacteroidota bacterium]
MKNLFTSASLLVLIGLSNLINAQNPHVTYFDNYKIVVTYNTNIDMNTINDNTVKVWGSYQGRISNTFSVTDSVVTITPTATRYKPGEEISLTITSGVQNMQSNPMPSFTWKKFAQVTSSTAGEFDVVSTGYAPSITSDGKLICADVNKDNRMDIIYYGKLSTQSGSYPYPWTYTYRMYVYMQLSNGTFDAAVDYSASTDITGIVVADFNNDGYPDIARSTSSTVQILRNNGNGTFLAPVSYSISSNNATIAAGDVDNDGDIDIVTITDNATSADNIGVLKNNGNGNFLTEVTVGLDYNGNGLTLGDLDNDGDLDLIATTYYCQANSGSYPYPVICTSISSIRIYENTNGSFALSRSITNDNNHWIRNIYDFNNDGKNDIITFPGDASNIRYYSGNGNFFLNDPVPVVGNTTASGQNGPIGDIDGDGDIDIIINDFTEDASPPNHYTLLNNGSASFTVNSGDIQNQSLVYNLADIDGDGDLDFAFIAPNDMLSIAYNRNCTSTIPTANSVIGCNGYTFTLTASGGTAYRWYTDSIGFNKVGSNSSYTTPVLNVSDTFYVANYSNGCESKRKMVKVTIYQIPVKTSMPTGVQLLCVNSPNTLYTTTKATNATSYKWFIAPTTAGTITGTDTAATVDWSTTFTGTVQITVRGNNSNVCDGPISDVLAVNIIPYPVKATKPSGQILFCINSSNATYTTTATYATSYQWAITPTTAGTITGTDTVATVDWNNTFTGTAKITVKGINTSICDGPISDTLVVNVIPYPVKAATPSGPISLCIYNPNTTTTTYTILKATNATSYQWFVTPTTAGIITGTDTSAIVDWNDTFVGTAQITVKGINTGICDGPVSDALTVNLILIPVKAATPSGPASLCIYNPNTTTTTYTILKATNATSYQWA